MKAKFTALFTRIQLARLTKARARRLVVYTRPEITHEAQTHEA